MGKTYMAKTLPGDFKVTTSENPLLSQQAVTIPNLYLDLFCSDNLSFSLRGSQYTTNQLRESQYATSITN